MKPIPEDLYRKIERVSKEVRNQLFRKGIVVPVKNSDGSITVGKFIIVKNSNSCYSVKNISGEIMVEGINLPQTAAVIANGLALGRFRDQQLLTHDKYYGFACFDEMVHRRAIERSGQKTLDFFELRSEKYNQARAKKQYHKTHVVTSYCKLVNSI